jgi:hypothetical protein
MGLESSFKETPMYAKEGMENYDDYSTPEGREKAIMRMTQKFGYRLDQMRYALQNGQEEEADKIHKENKALIKEIKKLEAMNKVD